MPHTNSVAVAYSAVAARGEVYQERADGLGISSDLDRTVGYGCQQIGSAMATEKITSYAGWPLFLPRDSEGLAKDVKKKLRVQLHEQGLEKYSGGADRGLADYYVKAEKKQQQMAPAPSADESV